MPTIRDVAKEAGVSVATVSRVINHPQTVREVTRVRVQEAIQSLNFRPDVTARRLSIGRTSTIGVILPFLTRPSFVERLRGIEAALTHSGYDLVVTNLESAAKRTTYYDTIINERRFDGTIVVSLYPTDEEAEAIVATQAPFVLVDTSHPLLASVDIDDVEGGRMAAAHLLEKGHRRIAFVGDRDYDLRFAASQERLDGFRMLLEQNGSPLREADCFWIPHGRREARDIVGQLLERAENERPTAIFATSDTTALGLLDGIRQLGLRAPDDFAIMGFDDLDVAELYDLTTIHQQLYESGTYAVQLLLAQLMSPRRTEPQHYMLPLSVVPRGTT